MTRTELFNLIKVKVEKINVNINREGFDDSVNEFIDWYFIGNNRKFRFDKKQRDVFLFFIMNRKNIYILNNVNN